MKDNIVIIVILIILGLLLLVPMVSASQPQPPLSKFEMCDKGDCEEPEDETFRDIACKNVTFRSISEDPLEKYLTFEWRVNNEKKGSGETLNYTLPKPYEQETITLIVTNEDGLNDSSSIRVISKNNLHHEIETLSVKRVQTEDDDFEEEHDDLEKRIRFVTGTNNNVTITREYEDDSCDDDLKTNVVGDVIVVESICTESECKTTLRFPEKGRSSIELIDSDLCGHSVSILLDVEVIVNRLPSSEVKGNNWVNEGECVNLYPDTKTGGDRDDEIVTFLWEIYNHKGELVDSSDEENYEICLDDPGVYDAYLTIWDTYGGTFQTEAYPIIFERTYNRKPTSSVWAPEEVRPYQEFTVNFWNCSDDWKIEEYYIEVTYLGKIVQNITSDMPEIPLSLNQSGSCTIMGTVTDGADIPDEDGHQFPLSDTSEVDVLVLEPEESEEDEALSEESEEQRQQKGEQTVEEDKPKKGKNTGSIITIVIVIVLIIAVIIVFIWRNNKKTRKLY